MPNFDLLCAGFPCQTFSNAGKKMGFLDETKGTLFFDVLNILQTKKPKYALLENVKHLVRHDSGRTWDTIIKSVKELGYTTTKYPLIISPHDIGIPQDRKRVFIPLVLDSGDEYLDIDSPGADKILPITKFLDKHVEDNFYLNDYLESVIDAWDEFITDIKKVNKRIPVLWLYEMKLEPRIDDTWSDWRIKYRNDMHAFYIKNKIYIDKWMKKYNVDSWKKREQKLEWQAGDTEVKKCFIQLRQSGIRFRRPKSFPTLVAMVQVPILRNSKGWRYLTPTENKRIQSFPKKHTPNNNNHMAYKQYGNAVNVDVTHYVLKEMFGKY